jgi:hypothetical protein
MEDSMQRIYCTFLLVLICSTALFSQAGSVELRTGGGTLIGSYASITEAYNVITTPLTQAYVIEILAAYTGSNETIPITFTNKDGVSASNTITLRPAAGNTGEIISGNSTSGILVLNDADYIIVDGRPGGVGSTPDLKIENLATTGTNSNTIWLLNGASNNVIKYVHAINYTQNTAGPRTIVIGTATSAGNNDNLITHCKIEGGRSGVGFPGTASYPNDNNTISNCEIFNWGYAGIWILSGTMNFTAESNKIYQTVGVNNTIVSGIIMSTMTGGTYNIRKNWFYDLQSTSTSTSTVIRGIYAAGPAAGSTFNIENNFVSNTLDNLNVQTVTGIEFLGSNVYTANIYYNTCRIGGTHSGGTAGATTSAGIRIGASGIILNMKNNIAVNNRTGGNVYHIGFAITTITGTLNIDYNCYYANGTNSFQAYWGTTGYNNLTDYKTAASPNEQNTLFKNVNFVSNTDLHLAGSSNGDLDLAGTPIPGITEDFDGDIRDPVLPYKGGDEADPIPVELTSFTANVSGNDIILNWATATETNNSGFAIERKSILNSKSEFRNSNWEEIGFVPGYGTSTEPRTYSYTDADLASGTYFYRIKQIDYNGTFTYYELSSSVEVSTPEVFDLAQNYPNPFNPATNIEYSIAEATNVQLVIFNSIGQEVAVLVNEMQQPGRYTVSFDATALSSGVYFYKITAGSYISIRKMMIMK